MKFKLILFAIFSTTIFCTLPVISSVELNQIKDAKEQQILKIYNNYQISKYKNIINIKYEKIEYKTFFKNLNIICNGQDKNLDENSPQQQCVILFIFLTVLFSTIARGATFVIALINTAIDFFGAIFTKFLSLAIEIIKFILKIFVVYMIAYFITAAFIDLSVLCIFLIIILLTGR
jgi:hypothetical protein